MSKRRNKNKKAGPVKLIKPGDPVVPEASSPAEDVSGYSAAEMELPAVNWDSHFAEDSVAEDAAEAAPPEDQPQHEQQPEYFDASAFDASAALAMAMESEPDPESPAAEETQNPDSPTDYSGHDDAHAAESATSNPFAMDEPPAAAMDEPPAADMEPTADSGFSAPARKSDRKLKLNKHQKHARSEPEPEPAAEPEAVAELEPAVEPELAPEPEPEPAPVIPRQAHVAAFAKLTEYQKLSLAHVPGVPEEVDVPGHWRGVGFGLGGRRLVSAFDEVVEIMRMPQITHVPGTQPWMLGVANVRGTLLPVVDLKQFLEGERTVMHEGQRVLVVRQGGGNVAVLIDQLFGQRSFNDTQKTVMAEDDSRYGHFVKQMYRVGDNDWGVFSMSMLSRTPEFRQAAA
jgi:twitching motility protein PilI